MYPSFDSIIEALEAGKLYSFPGGVHPDDKKSLSNTSVIKKPSLPELLIVPLRQHIGSDGICCVEVGDTVLKGQILSQSSSPFSVPVHAPTSGEVVAIAPHVVAHPSGLTEMCISIRPDGKDTWGDLSPIANYSELDKNKLIEAICQAGISGMGGAGFPTHIKTSTSKPVEFLILNGIECEPYITSDDRLMREHAWQIRQGLDILTHLIEPKAIVVAVEDNKPEAFEALNIACQDKKDYRVVSVETKYPAGGEKQLIQVVTGREVPRNGLPADVGVMMFNVGTCYAIADAILHGKPLIERIVTVTGEAVKSPSNFRALLGTPVSHLLEEAGYNPKKQKAPKVIMGGPMMGFTLSDATIPVVKTTNCLLVPAKKELVDDNAERPCIRCSACADACPASLLPQQIFWHAKAKEYDKAEEYDLFDCIECGACAYVCPSEIPLVHYYRQAKSEIRIQRDEKNKAEKAKQRFEARKERLEREKLEREAKHRKAKEARLAANKAKEQNAAAVDNANNSADATATEAKDKVAAALARAKAKKAAMQAKAKDENTPVNADEPSSPADDKKAQVAAAIARAKAKKAARTQGSEQAENATEPAAQAPSPEDDKKAKVAAAIARAKAKKAAQAGQYSDASTENQAGSQYEETAELSNTEPSNTETNSDLTAEAQKKARIAAAVAKAKAQKAAKNNASGQSEQATPTQFGEQRDNQSKEPLGETDAKDEKKARIAAAVAKAKAKKAASQQAQASTPVGEADTDSQNANLLKEANPQSVNGQDNSAQNNKALDSSSNLSEAEQKKARIAAAVAKAKAKKAAKQEDKIKGEQEDAGDSDLSMEATSTRKAQDVSSTPNENTKDAPSKSGTDEKKARIAAAVAKAKAKKLAQSTNDDLAASQDTAEQESYKGYEQCETTSEAEQVASVQSTSQPTAQDEKKARIAAAIAKAKAKKAAAEQEKESE
ncbi:electron transport complex subunit RsxC [Alteromonas sp. PRIM-21]|uniref:electron transport complex subunit RsxC n=1 Tax=Alteromonas sp. PRIM-21 TaxID=1454978 RepID=UPI0022B9C5DE|nr:electron transport complex subunit RsxC [Alteromonas sp. PRIM-21]MCZ8528088.1 electron transport complex subunit RsxC [Alteromonas sp. PRIM-21]